MLHGKKYGGILVSFRAKVPYHTWSLVLEHKVGEPPEDIIKSFEKKGWKKDDWKAPPFEGMDTTTLFKKGRGVFGSWTPRQQVKFMKEAITALGTLGINDVPQIKLTWQDTI